MTTPRPQFDFGGSFRRPPPTTLALMVITGVVSVLGMIDIGLFGTGGHFVRQLTFSPSQVLDGRKLWTPFIYLFLAPDPIVLALHEIFGLWMFAAPLERSWGQRRLLTYFFATGTGAALVAMLLGMVSLSLRLAVVSGSVVVSLSVLLAWILMNWESTVYLFVIPVRAPTLLVISLAMPVLYMLMGAWAPFVTPLAAMGIGYLLVGRRLSPRRSWLHFRSWWIDRQLKRRARHLRVVPPPEHDTTRDDDRPKYLN